jgi:hypothetical protein
MHKSGVAGRFSSTAPRRWGPWGWGALPSDKDKLISGFTDTAVQEFDNRMQGFMQNVRIDNEPREGEKAL